MAYELYVGSEYMGVDRGDKIGTYGVSEGLGFVGVGILYLMGLYEGLLKFNMGVGIRRLMGPFKM